MGSPRPARLCLLAALCLACAWQAHGLAGCTGNCCTYFKYTPMGKNKDCVTACARLSPSNTYKVLKRSNAALCLGGADGVPGAPQERREHATLFLQMHTSVDSSLAPQAPI